MDTSAVLSDKQLKSYKKVFNEFASNNILKKEDLPKAFAKVGIRPTKEEITDMLEEIGDENDIDLIEFTICIYYFLRAADSQEELINAFKIFDKDQTGKLPVNQVKEILASLKHPVSTSLVNEVLKQVPADRNNMVNYADMIRLMRPN